MKYTEFEYRAKILSKTCGNMKVFATEDWRKNEKMRTLDYFLQTQMHCDDWLKWAAYISF